MTELRKRIVKFCHIYYLEHDFAPSYQDIALRFGISYNRAKDNIMVLDQMGYIEHLGNRQIKVLYLP